MCLPSNIFRFLLTNTPFIYPRDFTDLVSVPKAMRSHISVAQPFFSSQPHFESCSCHMKCGFDCFTASVFLISTVSPIMLYGELE